MRGDDSQLCRRKEARPKLVGPYFYTFSRKHGLIYSDRKQTGDSLGREGRARPKGRRGRRKAQGPGSCLLCTAAPFLCLCPCVKTLRNCILDIRAVYRLSITPSKNARKAVFREDQLRNERPSPHVSGRARVCRRQPQRPAWQVTAGVRVTSVTDAWKMGGAGEGAIRTPHTPPTA